MIDIQNSTAGLRRNLLVAVLRWVVLAVVALAIYKFARVSPPQVGANISDLVMSNSDRVVSGILVTVFVVVSVIGRARIVQNVVLSTLETGALLVLTLLPDIDQRIGSLTGSRAFPYRWMFAMALAGATIGLFHSLKARR